MINVKKINEIIKIFFFFCFVMMNSGYMLQVCEGSIQTFIQNITLVIFFICFFIYFILKRNIKTLNKNEFIFLFFCVFYFISMIINRERLIPYLSQIACIFGGFYIVEKFDVKKIANVFVYGMTAIAIISLLFLLYITFFGAPETNLVSTTHSSNEYYNYYVFFYPKLWNNTFIRNCGLFWEPGLFSSYLIIALILEILFSDQISIFRFIILFVSVLTTESTAGILLLIPVIILLIDRCMIKGKNKLFVQIVLWFCLILLFLFSNDILNSLVSLNENIFGKLLNSDTTTTSTRMICPIINMQIFFKNPIFGAGLAGTTAMFNSLKFFYNVDSQTSTLTYMLAVIGFSGLIYTICWIKSIVDIRNYSITRKMVLLFVIFVILNKEPHNGLMATWLLFFLFQKMTNIKYMIKKEKNKNEFI